MLRFSFLKKKKNALDLLKRFKMERCKAISTLLVHNEKLSKEDCGDKANPTVYRSLIGSLLYLTTTRPDFMFVVNLLSRFMNSLGQVHFGVAKRVLRYVKGIADYDIWYGTSENDLLQGYSDNDWVGSADDMRSISGYVFSLGSNAFSWNSKK